MNNKELFLNFLITTPILLFSQDLQINGKINDKKENKYIVFGKGI